MSLKVVPCQLRPANLRHFRTQLNQRRGARGAGVRGRRGERGAGAGPPCEHAREVGVFLLELPPDIRT